VSKILLLGVTRSLDGGMLDLKFVILTVLNLPRQDFYHHGKFGRKRCNGVRCVK
jgi:hypothetical protein